MQNYLLEILPNYDQERVYPSDIKKMFQWYNLLHKSGNLKLEEAEEVKAEKKAPKAKKEAAEKEEATAKKAPAAKKPAAAAKPKAVAADKSKAAKPAAPKKTATTKTGSSRGK